MHETLKAIYNKVFVAPVGAFDTSEHLLDGLRRMETGAVEQVMRKVEPSVRHLVRQSRLSENLTRDILHDALVILIKKIRDDVFDPQESAPTTYLIGIAKNLIANHLRQIRIVPTTSLEEVAEVSDDYTHAFLEGRERRELLESLLARLGDPCAQLIRLKYLDGFRDEEILSQKMTHYHTPMALRSKRSKCFQKLMELASATKSENKTISHYEHPSEYEKTRHESRY